MYIETAREDDDADEEDQDLGWGRGRVNEMKNEAFSAVRSEKVSCEARNIANNQTGVPRATNQVEWGGRRRENKFENRNPIAVVNTPNAGRSGSRKDSSVELDEVVVRRKDNGNLVPFLPSKAGVHKVLEDGLNRSPEHEVDIGRVGLKTNAAKQEELSALSQAILGKQVTLPLGSLMKLIPPLLRTLGQETKGHPPDQKSADEDSGTDQPKKAVKNDLAKMKKVFLQASGRRPALGQPREGLILVPARVGRAKMMAVVDSGAMLDVISERMYIASGLARNNDTSMQIGDANGGMKECKGMIKNATIYLTEGELPTVGDLWVHGDTGSYDLLLGRRWATVNWAGLVEEPEGTYLKFASKGDDYRVNAAPNPRYDPTEEYAASDRDTGGASACIAQSRTPQEVYMVEASKSPAEEDGQKQSDRTKPPGTYEIGSSEYNEQSSEDESLEKEPGDLSDEFLRWHSERNEGKYAYRSREEPEGLEDSTSDEDDDEDRWERWASRWRDHNDKRRRDRTRRMDRAGKVVSRKRRTTDLRKRSRRWARNDDDSEEDERGGFWQEESSGEESSSSDERNIKDSDSEEFIRLVMQGGGGKAARTHHESGVGQDGETIAQDTGSLRKRTTGSRVVREPRPTWSVEDKDDIEESMEINPAKKGITEWPRNTNEPISARRRPQTLAAAVRRSRRTRNDTWGSRQKQWDLIQERCANMNSARGSHAQPRNAQILFSIARKDPALGPKQNNGLTTHQDGLETPDVTARPPNPLTQSSSRRTNRNPAERDRGRSAKPKVLSARENIVAELTDISSEDPEVQGNSRSAASPEEFPRHETVGVGRDKQDLREDAGIKQGGSMKEKRTPLLFFPNTHPNSLSVISRFVKTVDLVVILTLIDTTNLDLISVLLFSISFRSPPLPLYLAFYLFLLFLRLLDLSLFLLLSSPLSLSMTVEPLDNPSAGGPDFPSTTVSAVPLRSFFNIVFRGPDQELLVPIIYGTPEEGQTRLALAEAQIRHAAKVPDGLNPASIRVSHLHEFMSHYFNDGVAIRDFIGMGAVIFSPKPNGPKVSYTGDLFIRFVPCVPSCGSDPDISYPDPRAVQQMHQRFTEISHRLDEPVFIDLSHRHSFRRTTVPPPSLLDVPMGSPVPETKEEAQKARSVADRFLDEAAEEIRAKLRAAFEPPVTQPPQK
jgi:hypothetical protein